ncbi:hypothetical protein [Herbiconiux sp. VKM Ac-2851]|uniref:hypothetical protein n=1 Tax=Herbiconiux sp. VKM Ac-2851 TaxID=2739025 RepID=UPI001565A11F|nr:hypothetical protein [Herbiconiux sp. VKM Ac-2851]NQX33661.1 hypothetical protein [Herbiconiux sp. VKM Ac-2851]
MNDHSTDENSTDENRTSVSRRAVLTAAAWSMPVVAVAVATPARAASGDATGQVWVETVQGGTWVNPEYYGLWVQIRNNDTQSPSLPVEAITSATITVSLPLSAVGELQPVVIANAGGSSPVVPALPTTDPTWVAAGASDDGAGNAVYTLVYSGSIEGQGLSGVTFGILGPAGGLVSPVDYVITATGEPTDGYVDVFTGTLF